MAESIRETCSRDPAHIHATSPSSQTSKRILSSSIRFVPIHLAGFSPPFIWTSTHLLYDLIPHQLYYFCNHRRRYQFIFFLFQPIFESEIETAAGVEKPKKVAIFIVVDLQGDVLTGEEPNVVQGSIDNDNINNRGVNQS